MIEELIPVHAMNRYKSIDMRRVHMHPDFQ